MRDQRIRWTPERLEILRQLLKDVPLYVAAIKLGITPNSASRAAKRWGIPVPQRQHNPGRKHPWRRPWHRERQALLNTQKEETA